jgi:hypothetical protein
MAFEIQSFQSKGLRNDKGRKFIPSDYFYNIENMNYDTVTGCKKIKVPSISYNVGDGPIDGITRFRYINASSTFVSEDIIVRNGEVIKNFLVTPVVIYQGLTHSKKCTFSILNDKLFISNGVDYPLVYDGSYVKQMGSPTAKDLAHPGLLTGTYYYALTYEISGVEIILGTISNSVTVTSNSVTLSLPVGNSEVSQRKIYRTTAGGSELKLVATIADNVTTSYVDNIADGSLGATIPSVNSSCPTPQFITVKNEKIIGCVNPLRPNYLYVTEPEIEVFFNTSGVYDVSGIGNDNTRLTGLIPDYDKIIVFSEKHIYIADISGATTTIQQTTSNVGCADGFTIARIPENDIVTGGVMFVSNLYDVRIFSGNIATNLSTSFDNLKTQNYSSPLNNQGFITSLKNNDLHAAFYDYKYHLIVGDYIYVYDIRIAGWTKYFIKTENYTPRYWTFGQFDNKLFIGQKNAGIVEHMYQSDTYRGETIKAYLEIPEIAATEDFKLFSKLFIYYDKDGDNTVNINVTINSVRTKEGSFNYEGAAFSFDDFDENDFETNDDEEDYNVFYINQYGRWIRFRLETESQLSFRGWKILGEGTLP